jgi:hypothetical protein
MDDFTQAMNAVVDHGMAVIDKLSDEDLQKVMSILNGK